MGAIRGVVEAGRARTPPSPDRLLKRARRMYDHAMTAPSTRGAEGLDRYRFSVDDLDRMIAAGVLEPDARIELIDGELIRMSPVHSPHARFLIALAVALYGLQERGYWVGGPVSVRLSNSSQVEPDIAVYDRNALEGAVRAGDVRLAIEIADTTLAKDLRWKAPLYGAAGVPELWVVDLDGHITHVHREPAAAGYARVEPVAFDAPLAALCAPDLAVTLSDLA